MSGLKIYIPKALDFQRAAKAAVAAATQVDHGTEMNDAHAFALLEFFEFLAPEQIVPHMGPGLSAELSAIIETELAGDLFSNRTILQDLLFTHASLFAVLFCCDGEEEPRCYRTWLRFQKQNAAGSPCDRQACLTANFEAAMSLGQGSETSNPKLQLLKYRVATRTAELLLAAGFQPETTLRQIRKDDVPTPAEILAMQVFVLLKKSPDDLARVCAWAGRTCEATLLRWAARDSFVGDALIAWRWLNPVAYDQFPGAQSEGLQSHAGPLHTAWLEGKTAPAHLALREEPWTETDAEQPFPCVLAKDVKPRFSPVPLMLIGDRGVGKTAFLCALANHLNGSGGQVREGVNIESSDLQDLWQVMRGKWELGTTSSTSGAASYNLLVRDAQDPEVARWMRLRFTDYNGEEISRGKFTPELLKNLRTARGLLFFLDDRHFPDLLANGRDFGLSGDDHTDAAGLAARYTRILQLYFDINKDALHLPLALVVNKADLLLGPTNLLSLNPPVLIPERTKMELVHTGLGMQEEAGDPFERLRSCIRYNFAISQNSQNQRFVFELIERFKGFIAAAMCHTYRFQIFLICSVVPKNENCRFFPRGVWEITKWMFNQLDPGYRLQANDGVDRAHAELEELKSLLEAALIRDREAYIDFFKTVAMRKQVMAKVRINTLDRFLGDRMEHASERMQAALRDAIALAELPAVSDETDPAPFILRRRLAKEAMERLEYQIAYLKEWHERLSGVQKSVPWHPKPPKNEVMLLRNHLSSERRAS
jgi:hypothetical protein